MRRSAALLVLLLAVSPKPAHAVVDPAAAATFGVWTAITIARLMEIGDQVAEHFKEDVRRARDPHSVPPIVIPIGLPRPVPVVDEIPVRRAR